uniref:Uncharacterized protein n=1 Tax=Sphenodon punctatus TaxID=8508 RepID=A0A8D0GQL4_SPHPU
MAGPDPAANSQEEPTCSLCQEYFTDPVSIHCGHSFCRACIDQRWGEWEIHFSCPQCGESTRKRKFRPNQQLGDAVETAKRLKREAAKGSGGEGPRETRQEPLKLPCQQAQAAPLCPECETASLPRAHPALPLDKALQDYKEKAEAERREIVSEFEQLRRFLEEQERLLLAKLDELDKEIAKRREETVTRLSEEISHLSALIGEIEGKCQQPVGDFLQDIRSTLNRCERGQFQQPEETYPELGKKLDDFSQKASTLKETLRKFQDMVTSALEEVESVETPGEKAPETLDPDATQSQLALPESLKGLCWEETWQRLQAWQDPPDSPKRFDSRALVLGCDGFTSGRPYWELEVGEGDFWAVGVAREPAQKKGIFNFSPEEGIWAVGLCEGQYWALTSPLTPLSLSTPPRRIQISLDYAGERVTFLDADTEALIFTFPPVSFTGERIHPLLWVLGFPAQSVFLRHMGVRYPPGVHGLGFSSF